MYSGSRLRLLRQLLPRIPLAAPSSSLQTTRQYVFRTIWSAAHKQDESRSSDSKLHTTRLFEALNSHSNHREQADSVTDIPDDILLGRSLLSRPNASSTLELDNRVRCTVFDLQGNVSVISGAFKRSQLLSEHGLLPRDLRKLSSGFSNIVPTILVRQNSILVNLLHIKALIKADMVILFDAYGSTDSKTQSVFMYDLQHKLRHGSRTMGGLPYEMRALEATLISVVSALDAELQVNKTMVNSVLQSLEDDIDRDKLRQLLVQSKKLSAFHQKAMLIRDALDELMDQDEDLAGLYLTEKMNGTPRTETDDHSEIEMLLESYYKHCDEIVQTSGTLLLNIRSTEEIINIILDSNRNSLMLLDLKFQIGTLGLGGGAFIAALYGMNLKNFIEETDYGFFSVSGVVGLFSVLIVLWSLRSLRKVQRVTMMSDGQPPKKPKPSQPAAQTLASASLLKNHNQGFSSRSQAAQFKNFMSRVIHSSDAKYQSQKHDVIKSWLKNH